MFPPLLSKFGDPCAIWTQEKKRIHTRGVGQECAAFQAVCFIYIVPLAAYGEGQKEMSRNLDKTR